MFKKNLKLLATMFGLVAVLVMGLTVKVVTQEEPKGPGPCGRIGWPCIDRSQIIQGLQNLFAGLTASTADLLDFERAVFWTDGGPRQIAYIPPDLASGLWDRVQQLNDGETVEAPFGGLYLAQWEGAEGIFGR
ncbi:MAG: hypothetical protein RMJ29_08775, partial [Candidatus Bipolaricaulota bacterium]|nr:hypothetical protein [Candidatus Bipolaricaulota bacterium]